MRITRIYIVFIIFISIYGRSFAQKDSLKTYILKSIEVNQTRYESALENLSMTSRKYLLDSTLNASNNSLVSSLSIKVPSLFITERGFAGFGISNPAGIISIRGVGGIQQVLIIVDDVPQFAGLFGHPINDLHNVSSISDVEVINGPSSLMYGSNAMGGIIKITTSQSLKNGFNLNLNTNYGTYNTLMLSGSLGYVYENHSFNFGVYSMQTNNNRPNSSYRTGEARFKYNYTFNYNWRAQLSTIVSRIKSYNPGPVSAPNLNNSAWTDITRTSSDLSIKNKFDSIEGVTNIFFNNGVHDVYDGFHSNDYLLGMSIIEGISLSEKTVLTVGASAENYGGFARTVVPLVDTTITEIGGFATLSFQLDQKINFSGGFRIFNHSIYGFKAIPQVKVNYSPVKYTHLTLGISKGYRSPTVAELFLFGANINLQPEDLMSYEIGLKQELLDGKLKYGINYYWLKGNNIIIMTGQFPNLMNQNSGFINNHGVEFESDYSFSSNLTLSATYSRLKMEKIILGAPEQQYSLELITKDSRYELGLIVKGVENLYTLIDIAKSIMKTESYTVFNLYGSFNLTAGLNINFHLDNILEKKYEIINEYPMPGRNVMIGMRYTFN